MKVVVLDDYQGIAASLADWDRLGCDVEFVHEHLGNRDELIHRLKGVPILATMRERTRFDHTLLAALPSLELIAATGRPAAQAFVDAEAATRLGVCVAVTGSKSRAPYATAELTWGLILAVTRRIALEDRQLRASRWQTSVGVGVAGKRLGIVGLGRLGTQVAKVGQAFGMEVAAWSPTLTRERAEAAGVAYVSEEELFRTADILSVHLRLSEQTVGLISAPQLALMKPTAYLINTARAPIVDEQALTAALQEGRIAGAGLDVFWREPLPFDHPLLALDSVVMTPHLGYVVEEEMRCWYEASVSNIAAYLRGTPENLLNPEALAVERPRVARG